MGIYIVCGVVWLLGYMTLKDSLAGMSPGKAFIGLRVVDAETRKPIGAAESLDRNWPLCIPFFAIVELIVANRRSDKRRLGDLMANTDVIQD
ncbi:MAG: RDD family protein [Planctomycetes bacterium]|nr:RDD family protein [Planctomycetota bacterium]